MENSNQISIIIPSYNEEQLIKNTSEVVFDIMNQNNIPFEILFVDDGSKDGTWKKIFLYQRIIQIYMVFIFQETLEKNQLFMLVCNMQKGIAA